MKLKERNTAISLLNEHIKDNILNANFYLQLSKRTQPFYLKNFFKRLYIQKLRFNETLKNQLKSLEETEILYRAAATSTINEMKSGINTHFQSYTKSHFCECYQREYNSWMKYNRSLHDINSGMLRELLITHRFQIQSTINELRNIGADKYRI